MPDSPNAARIRDAIREMSVLYHGRLGLEPEVSFGTRLVGKRYGLFAITGYAPDNGEREGVIGGYQRYKVSVNYRYIAVVSSKEPPDHDIPANEYLNGEVAYHMVNVRETLEGFNVLMNQGKGVAEVRVETLDHFTTQQTRDPRPYEIGIVGNMSIFFYVRKGLSGEALEYPVEPANWG